MLDSNVKKLSDEESDNIVNFLDNNSNLKNGAVLVSLWEIQNLIGMLPDDSTDLAMIKDTSYKAFSRVAGAVYGYWGLASGDVKGKQSIEHLLGDLALCSKVIMRKSVQ